MGARLEFREWVVQGFRIQWRAVEFEVVTNMEPGVGTGRECGESLL